MNQHRESFNILRRDGRWGLLAFWRSRQSRAHSKQRALNPFGPIVDFLVGADATGKAQHGIQFVDGAIRLNAQVCLRDAYAAGQTGLSAVSTFRCDTHISSPFTPSASANGFRDSSTRIRITLRRAARSYRRTKSASRKSMTRGGRSENNCFSQKNQGSVAPISSTVRA